MEKRLVCDTNWHRSAGGGAVGITERPRQVATGTRASSVDAVINLSFKLGVRAAVDAQVLGINKIFVFKTFHAKVKSSN